jgi:hypothetical protein
MECGLRLTPSGDHKESCRSLKDNAGLAVNLITFESRYRQQKRTYDVTMKVP